MKNTITIDRCLGTCGRGRFSVAFARVLCRTVLSEWTGWTPKNCPSGGAARSASNSNQMRRQRRKLFASSAFGTQGMYTKSLSLISFYKKIVLFVKFVLSIDSVQFPRRLEQEYSVDELIKHGLDEGKECDWWSGQDSDQQFFNKYYYQGNYF